MNSFNYDYNVYACPKCKRQTEYQPNPAYMHTCENCGHKTTLSKLIEAVNVREARALIQDCKDTIKHVEKTLKEKFNV